MGRQLRSLDVAPRGSSSIPRKTTERRCRSRLKSSSFPSQCWLDSRSPCSGLPPCPATRPPSSPPQLPRPPFYRPPPSPPYSRPTLDLLRQWLEARDLPHLRHHRRRISFWTSRRSNKRQMKRQQERELTWTTSPRRRG